MADSDAASARLARSGAGAGGGGCCANVGRTALRVLHPLRPFPLTLSSETTTHCWPAVCPRQSCMSRQPAAARLQGAPPQHRHAGPLPAAPCVSCGDGWHRLTDTSNVGKLTCSAGGALAHTTGAPSAGPHGPGPSAAPLRRRQVNHDHYCCRNRIATHPSLVGRCTLVLLGGAERCALGGQLRRRARG